VSDVDYPGKGPGTYTHDDVLDAEHVRRLARACIRDLVSFACVWSPKKKAWWVWCPLNEKDQFVELIDKTRE